MKQFLIANLFHCFSFLFLPDTVLINNQIDNTNHVNLL